MKSETDNPSFVEYNDESLEHVSAGPDYGQTNGENTWNESILYSRLDEDIILEGVFC